MLLTLVAYVIALRVPQSIFDLATQYAFAGYSALSPLLVAALFWRGSTKWGALAVVIWVAAGIAAVAAIQVHVPAPAGPPTVLWEVGGLAGRVARGGRIAGLQPAAGGAADDRLRSC